MVTKQQILHALGAKDRRGVATVQLHQIRLPESLRGLFFVHGVVGVGVDDLLSIYDSAPDRAGMESN